MNFRMRLDRRRRPGLWLAAGLVGSLWLAGCKGLPTAGEKAARRDLGTVEEVYRPGQNRPALPALEPEAGLSNFLAFAMLNQPQVEAAYFDWAAAVERITQERSLPDPRLMFQTDIQRMVMALMPGLMIDLPGPGKLRAAALVATAENQARYHAFERAVLQAAYEVKKAYYQLYFLEEKIRVHRQTLALLSDLEQLARAQNEVGKVTLQDVLRAQIEQDRLVTDIENLEDSRRPLRAGFKAALGLTAAEAAPPVPRQFETTPLELDAEKLWAVALDRNPRLKAMEAEVRMAEAAIGLARKSRVPDFNLGIEADLKAAPVIWMPQAGLTLPVWRDKIAAQIAEAQASRRAAQARLSAEQIALAVELAERNFLFREASRNLDLLQNRLLPKARLSLEVARSGYLSGQIDFFNLIDSERTLLGFELDEVEARTQRELALAELSMLIAGLPPAGAPLLPASPGEARPAEPHQPRR